VVQPNPDFARSAVSLAHEKAERVILATSPIFPRCAVQSRLQWAGLSIDDFDYITSYENCSFSKPNPAYYTQILSEVGLDVKDCLMVGNDMQEDIEAAAAIGMEGYLITDCLIDRKQAPITCVHGSQKEFLQWL
ncbi:MAG: HAD family hydrolase, partial [Oscillospiraceae bacterium]|nr:HAD family hydrolase [Oscillospiraceae bacterium]